MKNKGKKPTHDVAPIVRAAFLNALERIKLEDGKTFSEIIADWMRSDPGAVLNAVSKFTVREATVQGNIEVNHAIELSDTERAARLAAILDRGREERARRTIDGGEVGAIAGPADGSTQH